MKDVISFLACCFMLIEADMPIKSHIFRHCRISGYILYSVEWWGDWWWAMFTFEWLMSCLFRSGMLPSFMLPPISVPSLVCRCPIIPYASWFSILPVVYEENPPSKYPELKFVFRLPAVGEVGGEILFRLRILHSIWILIPAVEGKGPPCCNGYVGSFAKWVLVGFYFMWLCLYCPIMCDWFWKFNESSLLLAIGRAK
jgi:hypothetical protein